MRKICRWNLGILILGVAGLSFAGDTAPSHNASSDDVLLLAKDGRSLCELVALVGTEPDLMLERATETIAGTIERWGGARPVVSKNENHTAELQNAIVLTTLERLSERHPEIVSASDAIRRTAFMDEQGFVIFPVDEDEARRLFVVSRTSRGVYNGAQYLHDLLIDDSNGALSVPFKTVIRSPGMSGRAVYLLTIWEHECQYTAADWAKVFDSFARDGHDRVYFWMSGHFPSKKFPQTYKVLNEFPERIYDRTAETRIGTVEDLRRIIREAHDRGLKLYIGGALGGWSGARFVTNLDPETIKTGPAIHSLCPSHPRVRRGLVEYFTEMFDALPEADGIYIESADEDGACLCATCSQPIDQYGSRQFGQSQLTLLQEMAASLWRSHPHARIAYTIGYSEHTQDPAYYEVVRQMSTDRRFEWMEARNSWVFPGPRGQELTPVYFSPQIMHWNIFEARPLETLIETANRSAQAGMYGLISDFSPGFDTGSFYKQIPFPTDWLPYVLTGFVFREVTWDPTLSPDDVRQRVREGFFGKEAPEALARDFWDLRDIIREPATDKLDEIQERINQARPGAGPKTRDSLILMQRAIDDIRAYIKSETGDNDPAQPQ